MRKIIATLIALIGMIGSAQQLALGTHHITGACQDVSFQLANPASLADSVGGWLQVGAMAPYAGTTGGAATYAGRLGAGTLGVGVRFLNYGTLQGYDDAGQPTAAFKANDAVLQVGYAHQKGAYAWGVAAKWVQSRLEAYQSSALLFDWSGLFIHPHKDFRIGMAVKNMGFRLSRYAGEGDFKPPLDVVAGLTFKPERMPFRVSITAHHLHRFDIAYSDPSLQGKVDALGNPLAESLSFADKLARHLAFGGEFVLGKSLGVQMGYSFLKRQALRLDTAPKTVGMSWGIVFRTTAWQASIARDAVFAGQGASFFSFSFNPKKLSRKRRVIE